MKNLVLLLVFCSVGCVINHGTDTGNPARPTLTSSDQTTAAHLAGAVCSRLESCFAVTQDSCYARMSYAPGTVSALGISSISSLYDLSVAEQSNVVTINIPQRDTCLIGISGLSCGQITSMGAYSSGTPDDYDSIHLIFGVDASCTQIFQE